MHGNLQKLDWLMTHSYKKWKNAMRLYCDKLDFNIQSISISIRKWAYLRYTLKKMYHRLENNNITEHSNKYFTPVTYIILSICTDLFAHNIGISQSIYNVFLLISCDNDHNDLFHLHCSSNQPQRSINHCYCPFNTMIHYT